MSESSGCFKNKFSGFEILQITHPYKVTPCSILRKEKIWTKSSWCMLTPFEMVFFLLLYQGLHFGAFWPPHPLPPQITSIFSLSNDVSFRKNVWLLICFQVVPCSNKTWPKRLKSLVLIKKQQSKKTKHQKAFQIRLINLVSLFSVFDLKWMALEGVYWT